MAAEDVAPTARSRHSAILVALLVLLDAASTVVAVGIATYWISPGAAFEELAEEFAARAPYLISFLIVWPLAAANHRLFISRRRDDLLSLVFDVTKCVALALIFTGFAVVFYTPRGAEPIFLSHFGLSALALIALYRVLLQVLLWHMRRRGFNERMVVIIGANQRTKHLAQIIIDNPHYGYRIVGVMDDDAERCHVLDEYDVPNLGRFQDLESVLKERVVDEVYICLPVRSRYETIQEIAHLCEDVDVSVRMVADLFPLRLATSRFHTLEDIPILALSTVPENQPQLILQRATDVLAASVLLLLLSPLFLITALAIKLESRGPVFFGQVRIGLNQRRFKMYKFRSMVANAEDMRKAVEALNEAEGPIFKASSDPRITRVGRVLRKFSIDELPQLFNVLKGNMSLVGPRPPLPQEVQQYSWQQRRRLSVKPGMTGLSQVSGRSELSFDDTVYLDLYYIDQWSLALVFRILLLTVPAVLKGRGAL